MCDFGHCSSTSVLKVPLEAITVRSLENNKELGNEGKPGAKTVLSLRVMYRGRCDLGRIAKED